MIRDKCVIFICIFMYLFLNLFTSALAIEAPEVEIIPSRISANASFLIIADPHPEPGENVRVMWYVGGTPDYGLFPKIGDKWMCYFSNTDPYATCGPSLFAQSWEYTLVTVAKNQYGNYTNETQGKTTIHVGGISLVPEISKSGNRITMVVYPNTVVDYVSYKVYSQSGDLIPEKSGSLTKNVFSYSGNITLENGVYYIAFETESSSLNDFGGTLVRVAVGVGETVPGYALKADPVRWSTVINKGETKERSGFRIINIGTTTLSNLSISMPEELSQYVEIILPKNELNASESMYYTVRLENIFSGMEIHANADILSGKEKVGEIPLEIYVSVINQSQEITEFSCEGKADGEYCLGGICCNGICREKANCCSDSDCPLGELCVNYVCKAVEQNECEGKEDGELCSIGVCYHGECVECYRDEHCSEGRCENNRCVVSQPENECYGKEDGELCSIGVCYHGECVECYRDEDCGGGMVCRDNVCVAAPSSGNIFLIVAVIALVGIGVIGGIVYFKKIKSKKAEEEEYEEGFEEEEFY